jgi:hypothetical protein
MIKIPHDNLFGGRKEDPYAKIVHKVPSTLDDELDFSKFSYS